MAPLTERDFEVLVALSKQTRRAFSSVKYSRKFDIPECIRHLTVHKMLSFKREDMGLVRLTPKGWAQVMSEESSNKYKASQRRYA
jgi:hypothetical protein